MKYPLNDNWHFTNGFDLKFLTAMPSTSEIVDIPHNMVSFPFNYYDETMFDILGTYRKDFEINDLKSTQTYILRFEGVNNSFTLYVNKTLVGTFARPYMEENIDITPYVFLGSNAIVVVVSGNEQINAPPFGHTVDFFSFPGIYREVSLHIYEAFDLLALDIDARMNGEVTVKPTFINKSGEAPVRVIYEVFDGTTLISTSEEQSFNVPTIKPWSLNEPHLYTLRVTCKVNDLTRHADFTFGFRDIAFNKTSFLLNGVTTPLVGLNRHETFPYLGAAAPAYLQVSDVVSLKALGVNYVRCSHYPPSRHFLDACDRLGLLVINEVPGWQHIGDAEWQKVHLQNVETMIRRDYNHPSIIAWSIRINESVDNDALYAASHALAKKLDPYRPTTGTRNFAHSAPLEDIYSFNDFSHYGPNAGLLPKRKVTHTKKPYIVSENNGHMYPTKPFDSPAITLSHVKRHLKVLDAYFADPNIVAISPWCMHDYYTHNEFGSGDKICYHGVLDINRQPKLAAYAYTSNFQSQPVLMPAFIGNNGDMPESILHETLVLSNAAKIKLIRGTNLIKTYYPRRDLYKHLPHPPFLIDTFISETFISDIKFSAKDRIKIGRLLNKAALKSFDKLSIFDKLVMLWMTLKYKLSRADHVALWSANVASWGQKNNEFIIISYNEKDEEIMRAPLSSTKATTYHFTLTKNELQNGETYDMTTLIVQSLAPYRNNYDFSVVTIKTSGPLVLVGPSAQSLHAGMLTLYFRSLKASGNATIDVSVNDIHKSFNVTIK